MSGVIFKAFPGFTFNIPGFNSVFQVSSNTNVKIAPVNLKSLTSSLTKKESLDDKVEKALN